MRVNTWPTRRPGATSRPGARPRHDSIDTLAASAADLGNGSRGDAEGVAAKRLLPTIKACARTRSSRRPSGRRGGCRRRLVHALC